MTDCFLWKRSAPSMSDAAPNGHPTPVLPGAPDPHRAQLDATDRHLARIEPALAVIRDAPGLASMAVDVVDDQAGRLRDRGVAPGARLLRQLDLTERLTAHGYASCPLVTGYGRLILAEFDYDGNVDSRFPFDTTKERYSMYVLKKDLLPNLYWHGMLQGRVGPGIERRRPHAGAGVPCSTLPPAERPTGVSPDGRIVATCLFPALNPTSEEVAPCCLQPSVELRQRVRAFAMLVPGECPPRTSRALSRRETERKRSTQGGVRWADAAHVEAPTRIDVPYAGHAQHLASKARKAPLEFRGALYC